MNIRPRFQEHLYCLVMPCFSGIHQRCHRGMVLPVPLAVYISTFVDEVL